MGISQAAERAALNKLVDYVSEAPEARIPKLMDAVDRYVPAGVFPVQRQAFRSAIDNRSNWYQLMMRVFDLNPEVRNRLIKCFLVDANVLAWPTTD